MRPPLRGRRAAARRLLDDARRTLAEAIAPREDGAPVAAGESKPGAAVAAREPSPGTPAAEREPQQDAAVAEREPQQDGEPVYDDPARRLDAARERLRTTINPPDDERT